MSDDKLPSTIVRPEIFKRSPPAGFDGVMDWSRWSAAIDTRGIAPMDIDASVEISNFFLWCETKDEGAKTSTGQQMALDAAIRTGLVTVIYQWGKIVPTAWRYETFLEGKSPIWSASNRCPWLDGDSVAEQIFQFIRRWSYHHRELDSEAWRRRLFEAGLKNCPHAIRQQLVERLRAEDRKALGDFSETPLGRSTVGDAS